MRGEVCVQLRDQRRGEGLEPRLRRGSDALGLGCDALRLGCDASGLGLGLGLALGLGLGLE